MKRKIIYMMIAGVALMVAISGCKKKDNIDPTTNPTTNTNYTSFSFPDSYGVMVAIKSVSYQEVLGVIIPVYLNTATAAFLSTPGASTFVDAGSVTVNSEPMTRNANNSYVYDKLTTPLTFGDVAWAVAGANGIPAFNYTDNNSWPAFGGYNSLPGTISRATGLTVALGNNVDNADSVYLIVASNDGKYVISRVGGNASEITITAADLSSVSEGGGLLQVVPWRYKKEDFDSKDIYFVLESVYSKTSITIN